MFKFLKDLTVSCISVFGMAAAIVVGFDIGGKIVDKINDKKTQKENKETPEIEEAQ